MSCIRKSSLSLNEPSIEDNQQRRRNVKGESFDPESFFEPPVYEKSEAEKKGIRRNLKTHFLFKSIAPETLDTVIDAMFRVNVHAGEVVIREGEEGDYFYCIQSGVFEVDKMVDGERRLLGYYDQEGCFGELALMHKVGRAVSITAARDGVLWAVDRTTFQRTLQGRAFKRRSFLENIVSTFPLLNALTESEKADVVDSMAEQTFEDGEVVFREGLPGNGMYWVISGEVLLTRMGLELKRLNKQGDYFGELALLSNTGRATTATAVGELRVAFLDVAAFERLLGPCMPMMKERMPNYKSEMEKLFSTFQNEDQDNND